MTLMFPKPIKQPKARPDGKDPAYLAKVRDLPCCICQAFGMVQRTETTAHHWIYKRPIPNQKTPDGQAIPLCDCHHQGLLGVSPERLAIHKGLETWVAAYGPDTDYIATTQDAVALLED